MGKIATYHFGYRLDGGDALSAAIVRLSLRRIHWFRQIRNLQNYGAPLVADNHKSRDDHELYFRYHPSANTGDCRLDGVVGLYEASAGACYDRYPRSFFPVEKGL